MLMPEDDMVRFSVIVVDESVKGESPVSTGFRDVAIASPMKSACPLLAAN